MSHPFRVRQRAALEDELFPDWTADAACNGQNRRQPLGHVAEGAFKDEVSASSVSYPIDVLEFIARRCALCPVRVRCAEYAYANEQTVGQRWWTGEPIEQDRRFGVYGALPGMERERLARYPDRIERGEAWLQGMAARYGWKVLGDVEEVAV